MNSQPQSLYDVPRASFDSVSQSRSSSSSTPHSSHKRSVPGYHNCRLKSQDHDSGFHSMGSSEKTLEGPPVRLDKHPSIRRKRDSEPFLRRSSSVQSPGSSFSERDLSEHVFEIDEPRPSHSDSPLDEAEVTGAMDGDSAESNSGRRLYDVVRDPGNHTHFVANAYEEGEKDEYMCMVNPRARNNNGGYVVMRPASQGSPNKSSTIPVPTPPHPTEEYHTLQHPNNNNNRMLQRTLSNNYDALPTISEREKQGVVSNEVESRPLQYENHPLPQDPKVMPRMYKPTYENHSGSFRGQRGSSGLDSYENITSETANGDEVLANSNANNSASKKRFSLRRKSSDKEDVSLNHSIPPRRNNIGQVVVDS